MKAINTSALGDPYLVIQGDAAAADYGDPKMLISTSRTYIKDLEVGNS